MRSVGHHRARRWGQALLVFGLWTTCALTALAQPSPYEVKAAFLYNFAKFVTWPPAAPGDDQLRVCVAGADPFGAAIDALAGKRVGTRVIFVRRMSEPPAAGVCHLLFVSSITDDPDRWLEAAPPGVLTVSEESTASRAGIIHLIVVDERIRFEIDRAASERAGIEVSSQLLRLAYRVKN
jgi:hypothetical protein